MEALRSKVPAPFVHTCQWLSSSRMALPLLLTVLAFALRVYRLDDQSLWFDEAWTADVVSHDCLAILQATAEDIHPPAFFLALHFWTIVLGDSAFALRMFSALPSVAAVAFTYSFARRLESHRTGLAAATILTLAPLQVYYAQEARSYALMPLLTLASSYCLLRACAEQRRPGPGLDMSGWLVGYVAVSTLNLYTHYTAAYVLVAQIFFLIHSCWRRRRLAATVLAAPLLIFLCYLPWGLYLWGHRPAWGEAALLVGSDPLPSRFLWLWRNLMAVNFGRTAIPPLAQDAAEILQVTGIIMLVVAALGAVRACRASIRAQSDAGWLVLWTFLIALVLFALITVPGDPRYVIVSAPSYYLLLALGITSIADIVRLGQHRFLRHIPVGAAALCLIVAASAFFLSNQYHKAQYRKADEFKRIFPAMEWLARPDDAAILTDPNLEVPLRYYWKGRLPEICLVPSEQDWANAQFRLSDAEARLRSVLASHSRYWLIEDLGISLDEWEVEHWLRGNTYELLQETYSRTRVSLFSVPKQRLAAKDLQVNFGGTLMLHDPESDGTVFESGSSVYHVLRWRVLAQSQADFSVSLWLADAGDHVYGIHNSLLSEWARSTANWVAGDEIEQRIALLVPPGTPPGTYKVKLAVYDIGTGLSLSLLDEGSVPIATELLLDQVEVVSSGFNLDGELAPVDHPVHKNLTDALRVLGYSGAPDRVLLGDTITFDVYWQAREKPTEDFLVAVGLLDTHGTPVYQDVAEPASGRHPFSAWNKGEIIIDKRSMVIPVDANVGQHQLFVALVDPETQSPRAEVVLGPVLVVDRPRTFKPPLIEHEVNSTLGGTVKLLGYELTPAVAPPGAPLHVVLYWQAEQPMQTSYTAFVHLVDNKQRIWGQMDSIPGRGTVPTTGWLQGEVIIDSYDVPVAEGAPDGSYHIEVGLYDAASGQRLPVAGSGGDVLGDSIVLDAVVNVVTP